MIFLLFLLFTTCCVSSLHGVMGGGRRLNQGRGLSGRTKVFSEIERGDL
jgi:hypothetical protein